MIDPSNYTVGLPIAASTYASKVDLSLNILQWGMVAIFVIWGIFFTYCLVRFRSRNNPSASYAAANKGGALSFLPDVMVLGFEIWLIFFLGLPIWAEIKETFPTAMESNVVELVAEQYAWGFQYSGDDGLFAKRDPKQISSGNTIGLDANDPNGKDDYVSINELHVPLGKPTLLYMSSKDVIHSFFVPEFRVKQDVVPGMRVPLWFEPTKTGRFEIGCAQLCGLGHYRMRGEVVVHTPEEFEVWKQEKMKEKEI
ncbi:MAG: Alternative cytochrome c oxidase subunit 2 [Elusimicrobia bacterium]|nr:Alternative cytochrome c oxidase subunit 2 [Elusimicrobiota bacterium]